MPENDFSIYEVNVSSKESANNVITNDGVVVQVGKRKFARVKVEKATME